MRMRCGHAYHQKCFEQYKWITCENRDRDVMCQQCGLKQFEVFDISYGSYARWTYSKRTKKRLAKRQRRLLARAIRRMNRRAAAGLNPDSHDTREEESD